MIKYSNFFSIILALFLFGCSGSTVLVNSETIIRESSKVEWVITNNDSTIDFRNSVEGYAKVQNNNLLFSTEKDSLKKLSISELKVIYLKEDSNLTTYLIGGIVITIVIVSYLFHNVNLTGG
jgi:hypothetical protein